MDQKTLDAMELGLGICAYNILPIGDSCVHQSLRTTTVFYSKVDKLILLEEKTEKNLPRELVCFHCSLWEILITILHVTQYD